MAYVDHIVSVFGGVRALARRLGKPSSTVGGWVDRGSIPDAEKAAILAAARADGVALTPEHFFPFEKMPPPAPTEEDAA